MTVTRPRMRDVIGYRLASAALRITSPEYRATLRALIVRGMDSIDAQQSPGAVSREAILSECAVSAALAKAQEDRRNVNREIVADMLAAACRAAAAGRR